MKQKTHRRKAARIMEMQRRSSLRQSRDKGLSEGMREFFAEQTRKAGALARKFRQL